MNQHKELCAPDTSLSSKSFGAEEQPGIFPAAPVPMWKQRNMHAEDWDDPPAETLGNLLGQESITHCHGMQMRAFPKASGSWMGTSSPLPFYTISHSAAMIPQVCSHVQAGRPYGSGYGAQWGSHHSEKCSGSICSPPPGHWLTRKPLTAHISTPVAWFIIFPVHMASCPSSGLLGVD